MKKRKTIGLLLNDIDGTYQAHLWLAFKQAAEAMNCNLMVFAGRTLNNKGFGAKQHHIIYNFVEKGSLDGLIVASASLSSFISPKEFEKFCKKYKDIPVVSLGIEIPKAASIVCKGKEGLKDLMRHLIDDHGYKKIMFVTGPHNNADAIERFEAYREVLLEKKISFDENMVYYGDFVADTGYKIMEEIILSNIEYDAIVFANDSMALGAMKSIDNMKKTGIYPKDKQVIICGFDDTIIARNAKLPLTTVKQPMSEMCTKAVELLVKEEFKEELIVFQSIMVKRASCGCSYNVVDGNNSNNKLTKLIAGYNVHENVQTYEVDELFDKLTLVLKQCFIDSCFIFKYLDGPYFYDVDMAFDDSFSVPQKSEMIYAYYRRERLAIDKSNKIIKTTTVLLECFLQDNRRVTYIIMPLFFSNEHFGYIYFEATDSNTMTYELLRGEISNTLKGALLILERNSIEEALRENERLASLGQLIGGISHNLMTPIMSIAGVSVALEDLINEYKESIGDSTLTNEDHYEISAEIAQWIKKLKEYNAYMSKVISNVNSQAVQLNYHSNNGFTIDELVNRIEFMKSSDITINNSSIELFVDANLDIFIPGDISNMVQVFENLLKNAIESYDDKELPGCKINIYIRKDKNLVTIAVEDFGCGIKDDIKSRLFKCMVTTKGKNGTGLSLLFSYSTIKGKFRGEIWFESEVSKGTTFYITVPVSETL